MNTAESAAWQVTLTPLLTPKDLISKKRFCVHREAFNLLYSWKEESNVESPCWPHMGTVQPPADAAHSSSLAGRFGMCSFQNVAQCLSAKMTFIVQGWREEK